ncbi:cell number regulator 2-like [Triticum dicoccoides]|uniref:Uncharacterized protein n=1 Tax=Triticum turgidum subsp. durum TaxID=4567 RepID=A0A9R1PAR8_TRITD|nr:cell number regulator 2-like [Triticum dicoccoides]VAH40032.1 unnamed protein product [Triticum turgidum subsp. durum]
MAGHRNKASWSSGLCGCFDDVSGCCLTFFCPCVVFGRIAEIVDKGAISCCASGTMYVMQALGTTAIGSIFYHCCYRARLRVEHGLEEKPCADCCVHTFCGYCALCQEYRELKSRGFDMHAGWHANMEKMGKTVAPQMNQGMTR